MFKAPDIQLRGFQPSDPDPVKAVIDLTIDACYTGLYSPGAVAYFKDYHSLDRILSDAETGRTLVAEVNGRIAATGTLVKAHILRVFVLPEVQGLGIGRRIMEALEGIAAGQGLPEVSLDISLPSLGFYKALGYRVVEEARIDVGEGEYLDYFKAVKRLAIPEDYTQ